MKRRDEVMVGLLLIVAVVVGLGGTIWIARGGLARYYNMYTRFQWGAGVKQGQPVLLAGVSIGFVQAVELIPDGTLALTLQIQQQYRIPTGSTASVQASGIFGDQLIAVTPIRAVKTFMPEGDTIPSGKGTPGTNELLTKGDSIASSIQALSTKARSEFVEGGGIADAHKTINDLTKLVASLSAVASEQSKQLTLTQLQLRKTIASIDSTKVDSTVVSLRAAAANLEKLSRSLDSTRLAVNATIAKANSGPGTVGRLMNDPALYDRVDSLLQRFDSLVTDLKKNPRRYINLRIF